MSEPKGPPSFKQLAGIAGVLVTTYGGGQYIEIQLQGNRVERLVEKQQETVIGLARVEERIDNLAQEVTLSRENAKKLSELEKLVAKIEERIAR